MLNALIAEKMKWHRTPFILVTIAAALSTPLVTFLSYSMSSITPTWLDFIIRSVFYYTSFMGPLIVTLIGAQSIATEYQNETWKLSLAGPIPREKTYLAKVLIGFIWIGLLSVLAFGGSLLAGVILQASGTFLLTDWLKPFVIMWLGVMAMLPLYHLITLMTRSFFVTSGVGIVSTFIGMIVFRSKYSGLFPLSSPTLLWYRDIEEFEGVVFIGSPVLWISILAGVMLIGLVGSLYYLKNADI